MQDRTNIYIMKPDSSKIVVGEIQVLNNGSERIKVNITGNDSVDNFNKNILKIIKNNNDIDDNELNFVFSDDMVGMIFHVMRWRRCTAYLVIQKSNNKTRYLAYLHDKIVHSSQAFGTTCNLVKFKNIKEGFKKALPLLIEKLRKAENILRLKDGINNMLLEFDDKFGI